MRKLLFESVFRQPLTERAPAPDDAAVAELAAARPDLHCAAEPIYLRPPDISQPKPRKP